MNIDEKSLDTYKRSKHKFSKNLHEGINFKKSKFKSDKLGRCAFLNEKGLCELIINLGEDSLCQVCRDHPRFRSFFDDRTEMGLGFCCEEAARIILSYNEKIQPLLVFDDGKQEKLDYNQQNVLTFRDKALNIIQDRTKNINERIGSLLSLCKAAILLKDFKKIIKTFYKFERLDKAWTNRLKSIKSKQFNINVNEKYALFCEQFLSNGFYRHFSVAEDTLWVRAIAIAQIISWWIINNIIEEEQRSTEVDFNLVVDVVRAFSGEVEYSQNNLDKLFLLAYKFIKI